MHDSAIINYEKFLEKHFKEDVSEIKVLDIGSFDVNGTLKPATLKFIPNAKYFGLDQQEGNNVDILGSSHSIPCADNSFDLIISSSCFEHDEMFWQTFKEMNRVAKKNALIYICAPSIGAYHGYPVDCWRFYLDSWKALEKWCPDLKLIESYIDEDSELFKDSVGIYEKIN